MLFPLLLVSGVLAPVVRPVLPTPPPASARRSVVMPRGHWSAPSMRSPRLRFTSYSAFSQAPDAADSLSDTEAQIVRLINADRAARALPLLALDLDLVQAARGHCLDMRRQGYFEHESPERSQRTPLDRYRFALARMGEKSPGALTLGENIFYCSATNAGTDMGYAHQALMNSPGHRANILNNRYTKVGVAVLRDADGELWVTEMFLRDSP